MALIDNFGRYYQIGSTEPGCDMYTLSVTIDAASGLLQVITVAEFDSFFPLLKCFFLLMLIAQIQYSPCIEGTLWSKNELAKTVLLYSLCSVFMHKSF